MCLLENLPANLLIRRNSICKPENDWLSCHRCDKSTSYNVCLNLRALRSAYRYCQLSENAMFGANCGQIKISTVHCKHFRVCSDRETQ